MEIILIIIIAWGVAGIFWAINHDIYPQDVHKYKLSTVVLGGLGWWFFYLCHKLKVRDRYSNLNLNISFPKPKMKNEYKD